MRVTRVGLPAVSIVAAAAVAMLFSGCGGSTAAPPPSSPDELRSNVPTSLPQLPDDQKVRAFRQALAQRQITIEAPGAVASQTCSEFDRATPIGTVIVGVQSASGLDENQAAFVVGAAVSTFCPQHLTELRNSVG